MDKNVLNVSFYDTKTKTGGSVQISQPAGDKLLDQILEAAKPEPSLINKEVEKPSGGSFTCPSAHSDIYAIQEDYRCMLSKGMVFPTYDPAKEYAETHTLPDFGKSMTEIKADKTEKTFKIKNLDKPLVVLFNGPPRSGKDSACEIIMKHFPEVHYVYFKEILYGETAKILGLDFNFWAKVCQDGDFKDSPMLVMSAGELMTPRDVLIYLAEKVLKPECGKDFIARGTADTIARLIQFQREQSNEAAVIVVPDLGFDYEVDTVREMLPNAHVISVAIHRPEFTFEGDSRNYVKNPNVMLYNYGSYDELRYQTLQTFKNIVLNIRPTPIIETM